MPSTSRAQAYRDALRIALDPRPGDTASQRLFAWAILCSARGRTLSRADLSRALRRPEAVA